jgi:glutathione S-transferase
MYQLFWAEGSAACGPRVVLEEIGAPYTLVATEIGAGKPRDPELLAHNPNGWVPVLLDGDMAMHEASAISIFLADRHPGAGLAPGPDEAARGPYLQWMVYLSNTLQIAYQLTYHWARYCSGEDARPSVQQRSCERLREVWGFIDDAIGERTWFVGDHFSAVDIHLHMLSTWLSPEMGHPELSDFPNAARIAARVAERSSVRLVHQLG